MTLTAPCFDQAVEILARIEAGAVPTREEQRVLLEIKRRQEVWNATHGVQVELSLSLRLALLGVA